MLLRTLAVTLAFATPVALGCGHGGPNRPATAGTEPHQEGEAREEASETPEQEAREHANGEHEEGEAHEKSESAEEEAREHAQGEAHEHGEGTLAHEKGESPETEAREQLGRAAAASKVSLAQGLEASAAKGQPISAKFEMEGGKLQLSIYTAKAGKFSEIVVDHDTGKIAETEAITGGEDLEAAQKQSQAMKSTKATLASAVKKAEKENAGYEAIRVEASSDGGKAVAMVTLVKGEDVKTAKEPL